MMKSALVIMALIAVCFPASSRFSAGVVKFGVNDVRSGPFKAVGDRTVWGIEAAVKEANDSGGILGRITELVIEDNELKTELAVENIDKLVNQHGCEVVIHSTSPNLGCAIAEAMPRYKKIYPNIGAYAMGITGKNFTPYAFRVIPNAGMVAKTLARYFSKHNYQTFLLINQDYSWGHDIANYFEKFIKEVFSRARILGKEFRKVYNKDFAPYIDKIRASGAAYIITGEWGVDLEQLVIQSRAEGVKRLFMCCFLDDDSVMSNIREGGPWAV